MPGLAPAHRAELVGELLHLRGPAGSAQVPQGAMRMAGQRGDRLESLPVADPNVFVCFFWLYFPRLVLGGIDLSTGFVSSGLKQMKDHVLVVHHTFELVLAIELRKRAVFFFFFKGTDFLEPAFHPRAI